MRIEEEYKKYGFFWLPGHEEKQVPGVISVCDGGDISLEIVGHLGEGAHALDYGPELDRVIGHIEKDGLVTLDDCFYTQKNFSFGGISKSKIVVGRMLVGAAWDKGEPVVFNTFEFSTDCLDEWIGISGIAVERLYEEKTAVISYSPPDNICFSLCEGVSLSILFSYTLPGYPVIKEAKITQSAYFKIESNTPRDLDYFIGLAHKVSNLLSFAMDAIVSIRNVSATFAELVERDSGYKVPIGIYYKSSSFSAEKVRRNQHEMLFTFHNIKENPQRVFENWLKAYEYLSPALGLYFSTKLGAQKYVDGKFLALVQGLETYHRRTSNESMMDEDSYRHLVNTILAGCPPEREAWLQGRLIHGNEINLRKRLQRIIEPFKSHIGSSPVRSKLLTRIVDTRNYLTHYDQSLHDKAANGKDLWLLCIKMEAIFNLHFLKVAGFSDLEVAALVENCYSLRRKLNIEKD